MPSKRTWCRKTRSITLERTACFGTCPAYRVTIDATGRVTYDGSAHVRVQGRQQARIPVGRVSALLDTVARIGFFTLQDHYVRPVTDGPTTYVTVTAGGKTKRIRDYLGAPAPLRALERQIDESAGTRRWIRIDEQALAQLVREGPAPSADELFQFMLNAVRHDDVGVVTALIALGVEPDQPFRGASGSLLQFVRSAAAARVLLAAGANPRGDANADMTPLGVAAYLAPEVTQVLLDAGAPANGGSDFSSQPPLIAAACVGNAGVVRLLVNAGADPAHRGRSGASALDCARREKDNHERNPAVRIAFEPPYSVDYDAVITLLERALAAGKRP